VSTFRWTNPTNRKQLGTRLAQQGAGASQRRRASIRFFDLIHCHSVFTHIDETFQDAWLGELQRIVKPDGLLLLSVAGDYAFQHFEDSWRKVGADPSTYRAIREREGLLYIAEDQWTGGPFPDFYHSAFHTPSYIFAHWSRYFRIRAYVPQGSLAFQDYVLLERVAPAHVTRSSSNQPTPRRARLFEKVQTMVNRMTSSLYTGRRDRDSPWALSAPLEAWRRRNGGGLQGA
jgi:SAM-dependent methyltransferase